MKNKNIERNILIGGIALSLILCGFAYKYKITIVAGDSMYPMFSNGDVLLTKRSKAPKTGDVIVFQPPNDWEFDREKLFKNDKFLKQVIASNGDCLQIHNNKIFVNNNEIIDFSEYYPENNRELDVCLTNDTMFVVGANIGNSFDSLYKFVNNDENYFVPIENTKFVYVRTIKENEK